MNARRIRQMPPGRKPYARYLRSCGGGVRKARAPSLSLPQ